MSRFLTADVVAALFAHFPEERFKSTSTELQAGFREVAREYPQLLGQISFGKVGAYVSSPTIEAALDSLAASGFCSRYTKDLVTYDLNRTALLDYYERFLSRRFDAADISVDTIRNAAEVLSRALTTIHRSSELERLLVTS